MYCFLCDRPARYAVRVIIRLGRGSRFTPAHTPHDTLDVCEDCLRRVSKVEFDQDDGEYVVHLQSLV